MDHSLHNPGHFLVPDLGTSAKQRTQAGHTYLYGATAFKLLLEFLLFLFQNYRHSPDRHCCFMGNDQIYAGSFSQDKTVSSLHQYPVCIVGYFRNGAERRVFFPEQGLIGLDDRFWPENPCVNY
jgi:hypothetical protein